MSYKDWEAKKEGKQGFGEEVASIPMGQESWAVHAEKEEDKAQKSKLRKINEATVEDLCQIKGIGPKIAKKIIGNGPYEGVSDIPVNRSIAEKLRNWLG